MHGNKRWPFEGVLPGMMPSANASSLLSSGLIDSYLTPELTIFDLLRCT